MRGHCSAVLGMPKLPLAGRAKMLLNTAQAPPRPTTTMMTINLIGMRGRRKIQYSNNPVAANSPTIRNGRDR